MSSYSQHFLETSYVGDSSLFLGCKFDSRFMIALTFCQDDEMDYSFKIVMS